MNKFNISTSVNKMFWVHHIINKYRLDIIACYIALITPIYYGCITYVLKPTTLFVVIRFTVYKIIDHL